MGIDSSNNNILVNNKQRRITMKKKNEITLQDLFDRLNDIQEQIDGFQNQFKIFWDSIKNAQTVIEEHSEPEIPNAAYVTLTEDGCFVGGEPTTQYNGEDIYRPYMCVAYFKEARDIIREEYGYELLELHCLQSSTVGEWAKTGNPVSDTNGIYSWVRAVYKDKEGRKAASLWVFFYTYSSASGCAGICASRCGDAVRYSSALRSGVFGSVRNDVNKGE